MWEYDWLFVVARVCHENRWNAIDFSVVTCIRHDQMMWQEGFTVISIDDEM